MFRFSIRDLATVFQWFDYRQHEADILVFILNNSDHASTQIPDFVRQTARVNTVLGPRVAFVLFDPNGRRLPELDTMNRVYSFGNLADPRDSWQDRLPKNEPEDFVLWSNYAFRGYDSVIDATTSMIGRICERAGVDRSQLPCLVIYYRGISECSVLPLIVVITIDGVLEVLGTVAERYEKIVEQTVNYVYSVEELTARVRQLADLMSRLDKRIAAIVRTLRSLRRKYKLDDQKIESLVGSYLAFRPPRNIGDYFEALANNPQHPLLKDSRFIGVQNAHKKMLRLQSELARYQDVQSEYLAAEDRIAALLGLKDLIELLSNDIGKLAGLKRGRRRLTVTLEWLDKALGILNKAGDLISSIGKYLPSS